MNSVSEIVEKIDGYHGVYTDKNGNRHKVKGTFALGPTLSWYNETGDYMVICGSDQGRTAESLHQDMMDDHEDARNLCHANRHELRMMTE